MPEIDLIPASWRAEQRTRRALTRGGAVLGGIVLAIAAGRLALEWSIREQQAAIQQVQGTRRDGERTTAQLAALEAGLAEARSQQALIATLRGEGFVASVMRPLDEILGDDIGFDELLYSRQSPLPVPGSPTPPPVEASLAIRGKAPHAAAIGEFADALGKAGPCTKPRMTPGNVKRYTRLELLEFTLSCPIKIRPGGST